MTPGHLSMKYHTWCANISDMLERYAVLGLLTNATGRVLCSAVGLYTPLGCGATMGQLVPDNVLVQWCALTHVVQVS